MTAMAGKSGFTKDALKNQPVLAPKNGFANVDEVFGPFLAANDGFANLEWIVRVSDGSDKRFCEEMSSPKFAKQSFDAL